MSRIVLNLTEAEFHLLASSVSVHRSAANYVLMKLRQKIKQLQGGE